MQNMEYQNEPQGYHSREVVCPFCSHRFMWINNHECFESVQYHRNKETKGKSVMLDVLNVERPLL